MANFKKILILSDKLAINSEFSFSKTLTMKFLPMKMKDLDFNTQKYFNKDG